MSCHLIIGAVWALYSFQRCPRHAWHGWRSTLVPKPLGTIEVALRDKPLGMLRASPKSTVPVLIAPTAIAASEQFVRDPLLTPHGILFCHQDQFCGRQTFMA
jgi:hypothetical protein